MNISDLSAELFKAVCKKYPNKQFLLGSAIVSSKYLLSKIKQSLQENPRISLDAISVKLNASKLDIINCLDDSIELVNGTLIYVNLYKKVILSLLFEELDHFISLQTLSEKLQLPSTWIKERIIHDLLNTEQLMCNNGYSVKCKQANEVESSNYYEASLIGKVFKFFDGKNEFFIKECAFDKVKEIFQAMLSDIQVPTDVYNETVKLAGFIPLSAFEKLLKDSDYLQYGKINKFMLTPYEHEKSLIEMATSFLAHNNYIDSSFCLNILNLQQRDIPTFLRQSFSNEFVLQNECFVFNEKLLNQIRSMCIARLQEGYFSPFKIENAHFGDVILSKIIQISGYSDYVFIKSGLFYSKIRMIDDGKEIDLISDSELKLCQKKLYQSSCSLQLKGFEILFRYNQEVATSLKNTFKLQHPLQVRNSDHFFDSYCLKKKEHHLLSILSETTNLPIALHARFSLFLMWKFPECIFEFTGKYIPPLLDAFHDENDFLCEFLQAKEAVKGKTKDNALLLQKLKSTAIN